MGYAHRMASRQSTALAEFPVPRIGAREALALHRAGQRIAFVDARRERDWRWASDKLPGATRFSADPDDTLPMLPSARTAVVYCASPGETSSVAAADTLRARGYLSVCVLTGGIGAWLQLGGPTEPR